MLNLFCGCTFLGFLKVTYGVNSICHAVITFGMMGMKLEIEFTVTEDEYVKAIKLHTKSSVKVRVICLMLGISAVFLYLYSAPNIFLFVAVGTCFGLIFGQEMTRRFIAPSQARSIYRSYKAMQEPIKLTLADNGIHLSAQSGESNLQWSRINAWRESDQLILVYEHDHLYHPIPKRIGEITITLRRLLVQNVGQPR